MQTELHGFGLNTDSRIHDTACYTQRHGDVSVLGVLGVAAYLGWRYRVFMHEVLDQHACARAGLAIYETQLTSNQVRKRPHQPCVFFPNHDALHPARTGNELVYPGLEQGL